MKDNLYWANNIGTQLLMNTEFQIGNTASPTANSTDTASPTANSTDTASPTANSTDTASPTANSTEYCLTKQGNSKI